MTNLDLTIQDKYENEIYSFKGIADWKIRYYMQEMREKIKLIEREKTSFCNVKRRHKQFKKWLWENTKNQPWIKEHRIFLWISLIIIMIYYLIRYSGTSLQMHAVVGIASMIYGSM